MDDTTLDMARTAWHKCRAILTPDELIALVILIQEVSEGDDARIAYLNTQARRLAPQEKQR